MSSTIEKPARSTARRSSGRRLAEPSSPFLVDPVEIKVSKWQEGLFAVDLVLLLSSPVYYGIGIPHGDGSAVVVIPGFLDWDTYLTVLSNWLKRIGYHAYHSGIGLNAECPDLIIKERLNRTVDKARRDSGRRVHLIGHSLGGIIARSVAAQRPRDVASVITLAAPFRGTVAHRSVLNSTELVRRFILLRHGSRVLPDCYTSRCTCDFVQSLRRDPPASVAQTAIYTRNDGVVDWRYCMTGDRNIDVEVRGTHAGLAFNADVYKVIGERLAA